MFEKRAFVHWIVANGVDEILMLEQRDNSRDSGLDYVEVKQAIEESGHMFIGQEPEEPFEWVDPDDGL